MRLVQLGPPKFDPQTGPPCHDCTAKCCKYFALEIDAPTKAKDHDNIRWYLLHEHIVVYRLDGALFFGAAQRFLTELTAIGDVRVVILRLSHIQVLDATGAQALGEIVEDLESRGTTVFLTGLRPEHRRILEVVGSLDNLAHERHIFDTLDDAIAHARNHLARPAKTPSGITT